VAHNTRDEPFIRYIRTDFVFGGGQHEEDDDLDFSVAYLSDTQKVELDVRQSIYLERPQDPTLLVEALLWAQRSGGITNVPFSAITSGVIPESPLARQLTREKIVIEKSPPTVEALGALLQSARDIDLFSLDGMATAKAAIAIVTLPVGRIVMGAVKGVSQGLEKGLSQWVQDRFRSRKPPRETAPTKKKAAAKKAKKAKAKKAKKSKKMLKR
jgi:hypothetical protein